MQRTLIVAAASALLLAAAVTELSSRLWPGNYFALLVLAFIALLVNGLFNIRQLGATSLFAGFASAAPAAVKAETASPAQQRQQPRNTDGQSAANERRTDGRRPRPSAERSERSERSERPERKERSERPDRPARAPAIPDGPREEGTVKWFNRSKGFGFIVRSNDEEIFVHQRSIRNEDGRGRPALRDGETVSFVVTHRERGQQAEDVVPVDPA